MVGLGLTLCILGVSNLWIPAAFLTVGAVFCICWFGASLVALVFMIVRFVERL